MKKITKIISTILAVAIICSTTVIASAKSSPLLEMDVNQDGEVSIVDSTFIQLYLVKRIELSDEQKQVADVNHDNSISIIDATSLQLYLVSVDTPPSKPTTTEPTTTEPTTTEPPTTEPPTTEPPTTKPPTTKPPTTKPPTTEPPTTKPPTTEPPTTKPASSFNDEYANEVLNIINKERKANGKKTLTYSKILTNAAKTRAKEIVKCFSHSRPDGSSCFTVVKNLGISWKALGENIAAGYGTPEAVMNGWMNSAGHRSNILNKNFESVGIACYENDGVYYWVQLFGSEW